MRRVAAVIPNWNGSAMLAQLLAALRVQSEPVDKIVVVDNGSSDESVAVAKKAGAEVIQLSANTGFSHAVNLGIAAAKTEWIAILNNDVVPSPAWLDTLLAKAESANVRFAVGKLLVASPGTGIDGAFDAISRGACAWRCGHGRLESPVWNQSRRIYFAPLTAAVFRAEVFEKIGLLDEAFESYLEDIDFGIRCAVNGLEGVYVPEAVARHTGSATLGRWHPATVRRIARNQLLIIAKHYPRGWVLRYGWPVFVAQTLWGLVAIRHGAGLAFLQGKLDGLRRFRGARGISAANFADIVRNSEQDILEIQRLTGFDTYWRLYFALT
jgi:GT2 family glycosyltransferase